MLVGNAPFLSRTIHVKSVFVHLLTVDLGILNCLAAARIPCNIANSFLFKYEMLIIATNVAGVGNI